MPNIRVTFDGFRDRSHDIVFAGMEELPLHMANAGLITGRCVIVTDANVGLLYGNLVERQLTAAGWRCLLVTLPPGEPTKTLDRLSEILDAALSFGIERRSPVIALGGGVVGDVAGFAASILMRGLPLVQVPTSLIAQVDSSVGGKTGVNHATGKNLIGAFHQPALVLTDTSKLLTLPDSEWLGGLSEVVKCGLIWDKDLLGLIRSRWDDILNRDPAIVSQVVSRCAAIKVDIVRSDERESGLRAILNFGHTFGHALEKIAGYSGVTHGIAVAAGMRAALHVSAQRYPMENFSDALEVADRLPRVNSESPKDGVTIHIDSLIEAMFMDKKRVGDTLRFILLDRVGSALVVEDVSEKEIRDGWEFSLGPFKSGFSNTDL